MKLKKLSLLLAVPVLALSLGACSKDAADDSAKAVGDAAKAAGDTAVHTAETAAGSVDECDANLSRQIRRNDRAGRARCHGHGSGWMARRQGTESAGQYYH